MANDFISNSTTNVAQPQSQKPAQPQEQKAIETKDKKPLSKNAQLVQELKKILTKLSSIERREKTSQNTLDKAKAELEKIAGEKVKYAELLKKFDVLAV